ncbi:hypothetical protein PM082_019289 [Marasmius tenuissimus]|nr:hypothetical protein PM082_019289 [Marasmius tenuissimus]
MRCYITMMGASHKVIKLGLSPTDLRITGGPPSQLSLMSIQTSTSTPAIMKREDVLPEPPETPASLWAFNILQILGFTLNMFVILIVAVNNKRVRRTIVWYLFISGWIVWCVVYGLLFILGYQGAQEPPPGLCSFQAAAIYAFPPSMALLTLGILTQLYCALYASIRQRRPIEHANKLIVSVPVAAFVGVFVAGLAIGIRYPESIQRDDTMMYCNSSVRILFNIAALLVGIASVLMLILESIVIVTLFNFWSAFTRIRAVPGNVLSGTMAFRVTIFSFMPMAALLLSAIAMFNKGPQGPSNVAIAFLPTVAALIFGTQKDVLSSWALWKRGSSPNETPQASSVGLPPLVRKEVIVSV